MNYFKTYNINYITKNSKVRTAEKKGGLSSLNDAIITVNEVDKRD
jgi:hypothetical protein